MFFSNALMFVLIKVCFLDKIFFLLAKVVKLFQEIKLKNNFMQVAA